MPDWLGVAPLGSVPLTWQSLGILSARAKDCYLNCSAPEGTERNVAVNMGLKGAQSSLFE